MHRSIKSHARPSRRPLAGEALRKYCAIPGFQGGLWALHMRKDDGIQGLWAP